jgi:thioredoxin reductase
LFAVQQKMMEAMIRGRLYGGGALVIGVDDGREAWEELDYDGVEKGGLKFVVVLNRYELNAGPRIYNVSSPYYTRPEYYTVSTPMFGFSGESGGAYPENTGVAQTGVLPPQSYGRAPPQPMAGKRGPDGTIGYGTYGPLQIHPSRVIEFPGNQLPDWRLAPLGGGWGDSVFQTVVDSLKDFAMIIGGLASMINDMKMDVVQIPGLSQILSKTDTQQKLFNRFGAANQMKSSINTLMLDIEEKWNRIQTSFGSTPELIKISMQVACAAGGIPESRAMGSAPNKGLDSAGGSGGEIDIKNYYDKIAGEQKNKWQPRMRPLDICLVRSALGRWDDQFDYVWNPLYQESPTEKAAVALQKAQTTQIYVNLGLLNEDAMRDAVVGQLEADETYPTLGDAIEEHGAEPEEPEAPPQQMLPTPPPGMLNKGQFDPNPFHMLRAQMAAKSGKPIKVPPNDPRRALPAPQQPTKDYDPDEPRDPVGKWTTGNYGLVPGDREKFKALKDQWATVNNSLLPYVDKPDSPEAKAKLNQLEDIAQAMHGLHADPGGPEGIGLPGGARDVTIIGAGPGGMAAAIMGGTEDRDTLLIEADVVAGGQAKYSSRIENYPGFTIGVTGERLARDAFEQAKRVGAEAKLGVRVMSLTYDAKTGMKHLVLSDGEQIDSRAVILAGGVEFRKLAFPGADGPGVIVGDGKELAKECAGGEAVVLGGSNGAAQAALGAALTAKHVTLMSRSSITHGMSAYQIVALHNNPKVTVIEGDNVASMQRGADGQPVSIHTSKGQVIPCKALGVFVGSVPETRWVEGSGVARDEAGRIKTDGNLETNIPGVFAIGDMREGAIGRIGVAVGEGQMAFRHSYQYLEGMQKAAGIAVDAWIGDASGWIAEMFDLDRDNPWFGQTVEGVKPGRLNDYDPGEPRDKGGQWTSSPSGGSRLKLPSDDKLPENLTEEDMLAMLRHERDLHAKIGKGDFTHDEYNGLFRDLTTTRARLGAAHRNNEAGFNRAFARGTIEQAPPVGSDAPSVFYHGTASDVAKKVKQQGLIPHASMGADEWARHAGMSGGPGRFTVDGRAQSVFIAAKPEMARTFADMAKTMHPKSSAKVLKITIPAEERAKLHYDEFFHGDPAHPDPNAFRFEGTIKPEWISEMPLPKKKMSFDAADDDLTFYVTVLGDQPEDDGDEIGDFNPYHDPDSGRFTTSQGTAAGRAKAAKAEATRAKRSASAKAAHAKRKARLAETFPVPPNASAHEVGLTAVARTIAKHKGHPTKGEIATAAKADVMSAVETFAQTQHLKTPKTPEGMSAEQMKTAYRVGVATRRFFSDPQSRAVIAQAVTKNTMSFMRSAASGLPEHVLTIAHKALVDRIVDYTEEGVTDVILAGVTAGAGALSGGAGIAGSVMAAPLLHAEIEHAVERIADKVGFTPEAIKEALHGVGHSLLAHYRKWREEASHMGRYLIGRPPYIRDPQLALEAAHDADDEPEDIIEQVLMGLSDVLDDGDDDLSA